MTPIRTHEIRMSLVTEGVPRTLKAVLAVPEGQGPWPGVVVLHEAFGVDDEMRKHVAHLAESGYLAIMPDLFSDGGFRRCISATMRSLASGEGRAFADIEAARQWLLVDERCTGRVGAIGFCMGGGFALMTAGSGFDAASVNYGMMPRDLDAALEGACPIITSYGKKDAVLLGATAKLDAALTRAGIPHDSKEYEGAGHVFMNEKLNGPRVSHPLIRVMGFGPRPEAAADAWRRIEAFFATYLRDPAR